MNKIILTELRQMEEKEGVKALFAVESGSRAWGFASPDSDYDVRFCYTRQVGEYLKLREPRDVVEWKLDEVLDINGWDLKKLLRLMASSNPTVLEWLWSPIVYLGSSNLPELQELARACFSVPSVYHHYFHMSSRNRAEHLQGDTVKLKKYLYVVRPILAARWVVRRGEPAPVPFAELVEGELEPAMRSTIEALLAEKATCGEHDGHAHIPELDRWIESSLADLEAFGRSPAMPSKPDTPWERLDGYMLASLGVN